ncbi:MAG: NgoFVII family restriction endonuclease, partial [Clostridiales bacterium]|nr:NgoFVII family restriction endonuclease [Clostridiales bacterium]
FRRYLTYLHELNLLSTEEEQLYSSIGHNFLNKIETTNMTKSYKMPVLNAFYNNGAIKMDITEEDIYQSIKKFYNQGINGKDLLKDKGTSDYRNWNKKQYVAKAKEQPVRFLKK